MAIADRVKALGFPRGKYAVFGSGPLEVHGIRHAKDVDIIVLTEFFNELKKDTSWKAEKLRDHHEVLKRDDVSIYDSWAPDSWDIPQMIKDADMIEDIPYVKLATVLEWKKIRNSEKDQPDIKLIEAYLASH